MISYIDEHKDTYGVEPICAQLPIAPSTYYDAKSRPPSPRACRDEALKREIARVHRENNKGVYSAYKVWRQLNREGIRVANCTTRRLFRELGLKGVKRGRTCRTTYGDKTAEKPADLVQRNFTATRPNQLWLADITYVATMENRFVYVAFIIDVYSRFLVGWRASSSLRSDLALDALEMAIWGRNQVQGLIHHSDRGSQYLAIRYTERLADAGIEPSVGSVGDSYDNAMAESIIGLYKAELVHHLGPWRNLDHVEFGTLEYVDWFNHRRLMGPIGDVPPAEFEAAYYAANEGTNAIAAEPVQLTITGVL